MHPSSIEKKVRLDAGKSEGNHRHKQESRIKAIEFSQIV
jgi:hypothetical protein